MQPRLVDRRPAQPHDLRVHRVADGLVGVPQHLVQLLARTRADEAHRDVARARLGIVRHPRLLPGEADHVAREVDDLHRLAHVEDEHLAALPHRARLQDQPGRLGDQHEVARRLRVGDGQLPRGHQLLAEDRDHAPHAAEDVAEPDGDEHRRPLPVGDVVDDQLRQPLRRPHHVRRAHRLVRRDENEPLHPELRGRLRHDARPQHVRLHRLHGVDLHHRHVLVRRRVEDDRGTMRADDLLDPSPVAHVADHGDQAQGRELLPHLHLEEEQRALRDLEQDQPRRRPPRDLAAQLGADRPRRPGHHHRAPL